jgi:hypothetical protein
MYFSRIPRKISREIGKMGRSIIIFLLELKSKGRTGNGDMRSRSLFVVDMYEATCTLNAKLEDAFLDAL